MLWMRADQTMLLLAQSIQQDLALVGINVRLKPVAWGPLLDAIREPHNVDLFMLAWEADFPDPENFLQVLFSKSQWRSNNDTFFLQSRGRSPNQGGRTDRRPQRGASPFITRPSESSSTRRRGCFCIIP